MEDVLLVLEGRFRGNLERVKGLVVLYDQVAGSSAGRASVRESESLRTAVIFLHATVEDLLRGLAEWRLPVASAEVLSQIPFVGGDGRKTTLTLGDLAAFRGRPAEHVILKSVIAYLDRSSYNNPQDIARLLGQIGLPQKAIEHLMNAQAAKLRTIMTRRHQIAHRLDRNDATGRGHHAAYSIGKVIVEKWIGPVRQFGTDSLAEVRNLPTV